MVSGDVGGVVMRWSWADGYIEVRDGEISGTEWLVSKINDAIIEGVYVRSDRFGTTLYQAGLDGYVQTLMTVEAVASTEGVRFLEVPPSPNKGLDVLDG